MENSEYIETFLDFIRTLKTDYDIAQMNAEESSKEIQDILHRLELKSDSDEDMTKMAVILKIVRQKRRTAKDTIAAATPVLKWADENRKTIQTLEKCLGDVRKTEKELENRHYTPKTNIISDILGYDEKLWTDGEEKENGKGA